MSTVKCQVFRADNDKFVSGYPATVIITHPQLGPVTYELEATQKVAQGVELSEMTTAARVAVLPTEWRRDDHNVFLVLIGIVENSSDTFELSYVVNGVEIASSINYIDYPVTPYLERNALEMEYDTLIEDRKDLLVQIDDLEQLLSDESQTQSTLLTNLEATNESIASVKPAGEAATSAIADVTAKLSKLTAQRETLQSNIDTYQKLAIAGGAFAGINILRRVL